MQNSLKIGLIILLTIVYFSSIASAALQEGLIGYWNLDEGTGNTAADSSENGNDLTRSGPAGWAPTDEARIGNSAYKNLSGNRGLFNKDTEVLNGLTSFSVSVWVKSDRTDTDRGFLNFRTPDSNEHYGFRYDNTGFLGGENNVIKAGVNTTGGTHQIESSGNVQTTDWQHLVFTWRSGEPIKLYIDGVVDTLSYVGAPVSGSITGTSKVRIGAGPRDNRTFGKGWRGYIDDVRIYNRPLTQTEITTLASGAITDGPVSTAGVRLAGVGNLSTERPSESGDAVYTVRITNTSTALDTFTLTTSGDVATTLSRNSVSLAPGASTDVVLTINENALTEVGEYEVTVTAISQADNTQTASVTTTTTIFTCGVELAGIGDLTKTLTDASAGVRYTIRVTNTGSKSDIVTLTTSGDVAASLSRSSVSLAPGGTINVILTIAANALTTPGTFKVKVKATSDKTKTAEITTTTTIASNYGVSLVGVGDLTTETADVSKGVSYTLRVSNTGNTTDTVTLTTSGDVTATLSETSVSLDAGASSDVTLTIDADALTTAGTYKVKVTATSKGDSTKTAEILTETTIPLVFDVELTSDADLTTETTDAGSQLSWTIRVTNTGNSGTAVLLAASGGVDVVFSQTGVPLKQNASTDVTITIAEDALAIMLTTPGDVEINVTATLAFSTTILDEITSTITIEQMPWDLNKDGTVNILDLVKVANDFGQSGDGHPADVNGDRNVNILDLVQVASNFGETQVDYALANLTVSHD